MRPSALTVRNGLALVCIGRGLFFDKQVAGLAIQHVANLQQHIAGDPVPIVVHHRGHRGLRDAGLLGELVLLEIVFGE